MVKPQINNFLDAYEKCLQSKSTSAFEKFQLEYVVGASPLPELLSNAADQRDREQVYILVSKLSPHCIPKKQQPSDSSDVEILAINSLSPFLRNNNNPSNNDDDSGGLKNDVTTDYFDESIRAPAMDTITSLIGSPLKLHDYQKEVQLASWDEVVGGANVGRLPVKSHEASLLISFYNIGVARKVKEDAKFGIARLWVMSNASDYNKTIYLSSLIIIDNAGVIDNNGGHEMYTLNRVEVTCENHLHNDDDDDETSVRCLLSPSLLSCKNLKFSYSSTYVLYKSHASTGNHDDHNKINVDNNNNNNTDNVKNDNGDNNDNNYLSHAKNSNNNNGVSVKVTVDWSTESALLAPPPLLDSASLSIEVVDGEGSTLSSMLHNDLSSLQRLVRGLDEGEVVWKVGEVDGESVNGRIVHLIESTRPKSKIMLAGIPQQPTTTPDDHLLYHLSSTRNHDFADHLWTVLRDCTSHAELVGGIQMIFEAVQKKLIQPTISSCNKTTLAQIIRQSSHASIEKEVYDWLRGDRPLLLLVELGIEKLKMDYLNIFLGSRLVKQADLAYYLGSSTFESVNVQLNKLAKLHHVLELNQLLHLRTSLPSTLLTQVLRYSLRHYHGDHAGGGGLHVPIPVIDLCDHIESSLPSEWRCVATGRMNQNSEDNNSTIINTNSNDGDDGDDDDDDDSGALVCNCIHLSKLSIFPHISDVYDDVDAIVFKHKYWLTCVLQHVDNFVL